VKRISAFDTPAYTGEQVPEELLPLLVRRSGSRSVRSWGANSSVYQSKVLGVFPDLSSDDTLILPKWIESAQGRTLERTRRPFMAADVARARVMRQLPSPADNGYWRFPVSMFLEVVEANVGTAVQLVTPPRDTRRVGS
jgi:hypothetical protein